MAAFALAPPLSLGSRAVVPVRGQAQCRPAQPAAAAVRGKHGPSSELESAPQPAVLDRVFELQRAFEAARAAVSIPGSGGAGGLKGGAAVLERPSVIGEIDIDAAWAAEMKRRRSMGKKYRVLLFNDPFNKREYVVQALLKVIDGLTVADAVNIMSKAHNDGFAVAAVVVQEVAELYVAGLRDHGLTSTCEPDE